MRSCQELHLDLSSRSPSHSAVPPKCECERESDRDARTDGEKSDGEDTEEEEDTEAIIQIYDLAETFHWVKDIGYAIINYVELQIGGVNFERFHS